MGGTGTSLRDQLKIAVFGALLGIAGTFVVWSISVRPQVKFTIYNQPYSISSWGATPFTIGLKNTGGTDVTVWTVVTAENATIVSWDKPNVERIDRGIRIKSTVERETKDWRVFNVEVLLEDLPPSFRISVGVERIVTPSISMISESLADVRPVDPISAIYMLQERKDNVAVYSPTEHHMGAGTSVIQIDLANVVLAIAAIIGLILTYYVGVHRPRKERAQKDKIELWKPLYEKADQMVHTLSQYGCLGYGFANYSPWVENRSRVSKTLRSMIDETLEPLVHEYHGWWQAIRDSIRATICYWCSRNGNRDLASEYRSLGKGALEEDLESMMYTPIVEKEEITSSWVEYHYPEVYKSIRKCQQADRFDELIKSIQEQVTRSSTMARFEKARNDVLQPTRELKSLFEEKMR